MTHHRRETMLTRGAAALAAALAASSLGGCAWTERATLGPNGAQAESGSGGPVISDDGRFVAFYTRAANLLPAGVDTNAENDVFVRDLDTGTTARVSTASGGAEVTGFSGVPSISGDGRYVAFESDSTTLVAGDTNARTDIFVKDRTTNATTRVSVATGGVQANNRSTNPKISGDGRYVVFASLASNLVSGDTNGTEDAFLHDRQTGITERVSLNSSEQQAASPCWSRHPAVSDDGRFIAFQSNPCAWGLPSVLNGASIWLRDRTLGTTLIIAGGSTIGDPAFHTSPIISGNGRYVGWWTSESNVVPGDNNLAADIFLYDRVLGTYEMGSVGNGGVQANGYAGSTASISNDGRWLGFTSEATNLVPNDTNDRSDAFVRDRATSRVFLVSTDILLAQGNDHSFNAAVSGDGKYVAYLSFATNLVSGDTNAVDDIFVQAANRPTVDFITPGSVVRGFSGPVMIAGVAFEPGGILQTSSNKITFSNIVYVDTQTITATMTVAADAPVGNHDVIVGNPGGAWEPIKGASSQCAGCLQVQ
jgi:Tol biopolymer transport system component